MVNVSSKPATSRTAKATATIHLGTSVYQAITQQSAQQPTSAKGDILGVARVSGILATKKTSDLIPLCHPLSLNGVDIEFEMDEREGKVDVRSEVSCEGKTGVEMEALTAVSVAALTVYDMCKAVSKDIRISDIKLVEKRGGKSGIYKTST